MVFKMLDFFKLWVDFGFIEFVFFGSGTLLSIFYLWQFSKFSKEAIERVVEYKYVKKKKKKTMNIIKVVRRKCRDVIQYAWRIQESDIRLFHVYRHTTSLTNIIVLSLLQLGDSDLAMLSAAGGHRNS